MDIEIEFIQYHGETPESALREMTKRFDGLVAMVIEQTGDNGWPTAKVSGPTDTVVEFAEKFGYEV